MVPVASKATGELGQQGAVMPSAGLTKAVVVHSGGRDSYQLALALAEAGLLEALVTDLFWPADKPWASWVKSRLPAGLRELVGRRSVAGLGAEQVQMCGVSGMRTLLLDKVPRVPLSVRRRSSRAADAKLGRVAGERARRKGAGLVSYSYYGYDAMTAYGRAAMLFQLHPHPATMRRLLLQELEDHPDCAASLRQEWELALPEEDFQHLVEEPRMASHLLVASTFTRNSLIEHGTLPERISVVPYGVDLERFRPAAAEHVPGNPLRLLFVGRINQRKGIKYLLEALRLLPPGAVHVTICGRVVDGLALFREFGEQVEVRASVSEAELLQAYQTADLFVFPSVAEGFGQVLLESLACGLPILSTTHTAAPDLIQEGVEGFVIEPRSAELLAARILWALDHREALQAMRVPARLCAERFSWQQFRKKVAVAVEQYLEQAKHEQAKPERPCP